MRPRFTLISASISRKLSQPETGGDPVHDVDRIARRVAADDFGKKPRVIVEMVSPVRSKALPTTRGHHDHRAAAAIVDVVEHRHGVVVLFELLAPDLLRRPGGRVANTGAPPRQLERLVGLGLQALVEIDPAPTACRRARRQDRGRRPALSRASRRRRGRRTSPRARGPCRLAAPVDFDASSRSPHRSSSICGRRSRCRGSRRLTCGSHSGRVRCTSRQLRTA